MCVINSVSVSDITSHRHSKQRIV